MRSRLLTLALLCPVLAACPPTEPEVTYQGTIRAALEEHCVTCHQADDIAPFSLEDWSQVEPLGSAIVASVEEGTMPPFHFDEDCREVTNSEALDPQVVELFQAWRDDGFAAGDPADYVAPTLPEEPELGEPDLLLSPDPGYLPDGTVQDDYRCLLIDQEFEEDVFVTHADIFPDRKDLVHHVIVFSVPASASEELAERAAAEEGPGYTCFGDAGIESAHMLTGWAPGPPAAPPMSGGAMRIDAGATLVMQVHFNTTSASLAEDGAPDRSELALWTLPAGEEPDHLLTLFPVANPTLNIAAGDAESVQEALVHIPVDATVLGSAPHMHLLGSSLSTEIIRPDGSTECITKVEPWDFNWQRSYFVPEGQRTTVDIDDTLRLRCTYDNSPSNQPFVDGVQVEPQDVSWGEGTYDEMCLDFLLLSTPYRGNGQTGICAGFQGCLADCSPDDGTCALECMGSTGLGCLRCALTPLFGSCMQSECGLAMLNFSSCFDTCSSSQDFLECGVMTCREEWDEMAACMDPVLRAGTCAEDFAACGGLAP